MKRMSAFLILATLIFAGCEYEAPLVKEHTIAIDPAVLGRWVPNKDTDDGEEAEKMIILKFSDTEYLIHYPANNDGLYYRGYPIKIGGKSCVQLEVIGSAEGAMKPDMKERFHVVAYELKNGLLEIKILNTELVTDELKTTEDLQQAFLKIKDNQELFKNPGVFKKGP